MHIELVSVLLFVSALISPLKAAYSSEVDAKIFVKEASEKLYKLYDNIADEIYVSTNDDDDFETLFNKLTTVQHISKGLVDISKESKQFNTADFKDPELKNALKKLRGAAYLFVLEDDYFSNLLLTINALKELSTDKDIEPYRNDGGDENLAYYPDIQRIFATIQDPQELKYYWEAWREKNIIWAGMHFNNLIESFQKAANISDIPILDLWFQYSDDAKFLSEMEAVMNQIKPFYMQLHAFVRNELVKKYGESVVGAKGPIPEHLLQQVLVQAWMNGSVIEHSFPSHDLPNYDKTLQDKGYDALKLFKTADKFYESMGLKAMNSEFWQNRSKIDSDDEGDCKADIYDVTPNVYMKYCKKVDFKKFLQAHGYMGRVHYSYEKKQLPFYYFDSYDLEYPVGEAILLSASTPSHMAKLDLVPTNKFNGDIMMNRLFRMGIHTMFNIPVYFVHTKMMNDLLSGELAFDDINKRYWQLMEEFVGVEPPVDRKADAIDFPYKFYEDMEENHQTRKFVSEILGYQIYRSLCMKSGQYTTGGDLHNCDFYGSKEAGNALSEMMSLGSSKPWRTVLSKVISDKPGLNGDALMEYYEPIRRWLENKNKENGVKIGWEHSKKKVLAE